MPGEKLTPARIGLCCTVGRDKVQVYRKIRVIGRVFTLKNPLLDTCSIFNWGRVGRNWSREPRFRPGLRFKSACAQSIAGESRTL